MLPGPVLCLEIQIWNSKYALLKGKIIPDACKKQRFSFSFWWDWSQIRFFVLFSHRNMWAHFSLFC